MCVRVSVRARVCHGCCKVDLTGLCSTPPPPPHATLSASIHVSIQRSCFHINFYDLRFEEGSLLSSALLAFGKKNVF